MSGDTRNQTAEARMEEGLPLLSDIEAAPVLTAPTGGPLKVSPSVRASPAYLKHLQEQDPLQDLEDRMRTSLQLMTLQHIAEFEEGQTRKRWWQSETPGERVQREAYLLDVERFQKHQQKYLTERAPDVASY